MKKGYYHSLNKIMLIQPILGSWERISDLCSAISLISGSEKFKNPGSYKYVHTDDSIFSLLYNVRLIMGARAQNAAT